MSLNNHIPGEENQGGQNSHSLAGPRILSSITKGIAAVAMSVAALSSCGKEIDTRKDIALQEIVKDPALYTSKEVATPAGKYKENLIITTSGYLEKKGTYTKIIPTTTPVLVGKTGALLVIDIETNFDQYILHSSPICDSENESLHMTVKQSDLAKIAPEGEVLSSDHKYTIVGKLEKRSDGDATERFTLVPSHIARISQ